MWDLNYQPQLGEFAGFLNHQQVLLGNNPMESSNKSPRCQWSVTMLGGGLKYFLFSPRKLGNISNLTHIFQNVETTN